MSTGEGTEHGKEGNGTEHGKSGRGQRIRESGRGQRIRESEKEHRERERASKKRERTVLSNALHLFCHSPRPRPPGPTRPFPWPLSGAAQVPSPFPLSPFRLFSRDPCSPPRDVLGRALLAASTAAGAAENLLGERQLGRLALVHVGQRHLWRPTSQNRAWQAGVRFPRLCAAWRAPPVRVFKGGP